jgi:AraC-like DNA-binding protein
MFNLENQFSLFDLLILIGIFQGVITAILLVKSKKNTRSNKFLALGLLSFCLLCTKPLLHTLSLWDTHVFRFFPNALELATPPLIYFYVKSLITPKFYFKTNYWLHFIPFFISQTFAFIIYFVVLTTNDLHEKDILAESLKFDELKQMDEYLLLFFFPFYLFYGYKELISYKKWINTVATDNTFPDFNWLKNIFQLFILLFIFILVNHSLNIFFDFKSISLFHFHLLTLFIAFLIYYLGLKGYLQPDYSFVENKKNTKKQVPLSSAKSTEIVKKIKKAMHEDKVFLNPKLSIYELSTILDLPQREISLVINQHFQTSFRDLINSYRLEEVKSKLDNPSYKHMSILGIALESGFNSEASFYRIFKKSIGMSPKEFIQNKKRQ